MPPDMQAVLSIILIIAALAIFALHWKAHSRLTSAAEDLAASCHDMTNTFDQSTLASQQSAESTQRTEDALNKSKHTRLKS